MSFKPVARELFSEEDATSSCIIEEFNSACEANRQIEGDGSRCVGCDTLIVQSLDHKRERFYCGGGCVGVNLGPRLRADAFITYYASPIASAVRVRSLPIDGYNIIMSFLYHNHLGYGDMATKWNQIQHTVLFKRKMIVDK